LSFLTTKKKKTRTKRSPLSRSQPRSRAGEGTGGRTGDEAVDAEKTKAAAEVERLAEEEAQLEHEVDCLRATLAERRSRHEELDETLAFRRARLKRLHEKSLPPDALEVLRREVEEAEGLQREIAAFGGIEEELSEAVDVYEQQFEERKRLQNLVHELKGNVRVFCRCRPALGKEVDTGMAECVSFPTSCKLIVDDEEAGRKKEFTFDEIFAPGCVGGLCV
jgi:hypothetical protein